MKRKAFSYFFFIFSSVILISSSGYYIHQVYLKKNFGVVVEGAVYRSAQPGVDDLKNWMKHYGIVSVINLRGWDPGDDQMSEQEYLAGQDLQQFRISLSAHEAPTRDRFIALVHTLEKAERPMLIHCRMGADRTGFASVLAAMVIGGHTYECARNHLGWHHFHFNLPPQGIEKVFEWYENYCLQNSRETAGWKQFKTWVYNDYHPTGMKILRERVIPQKTALPKSFPSSPGFKADTGKDSAG